MGESMPGNVQDVVARYSGDGPAAKKIIGDTPGLKGKLSELATQLASVQNENDAIRGRYLELEDAWQGMIEQNKEVHAQNQELRDQLSATETKLGMAEDRNNELAAANAKLVAECERLSASEKKAVNDLKEEQLLLGKKNVESDMLRNETMNLDHEGRKLKEDWDDKVYKLRKAEEARDHYKSELNKLAQ